MKDLSKDSARRLTVGEAGAGQRVDNFLLRHLKGVPKSHVYRLLRRGEVRLNSGRVKPDAKLAEGDVLRIPPLRTATSDDERWRPRGGTLQSKLPVLYEDDALIAIDKPAGLAVHGGSGVSLGLIEQLRASRPTAPFLELVHRLDRDTSGILLIAKQRSALTKLHAALREGRVDKRYIVLVRGRWRDETRRVDLPLHKFLSAEGERRVRVEGERGKAATTVFRRQRVWRGEPALSLLEAQLRTGRTHQIRVHLTHLGFPLAGDDKYGDFGWNRMLARHGLKRMFLHAWRLSLAHPVEARRLELESPLPLELSGFLAQLHGMEHSDG
jgi:23S rRNA pseudouridine955/2504/2580 synthase